MRSCCKVAACASEHQSILTTASKGKSEVRLLFVGDLAPRTPVRHETIFHYMGSLDLFEAVEAQLVDMADDIVISHELVSKSLVVT